MECTEMLSVPSSKRVKTSDSRHWKVNLEAVLGQKMMGGGASRLATTMATVGVPSMSKQTFTTTERAWLCRKGETTYSYINMYMYRAKLESVVQEHPRYKETPGMWTNYGKDLRNAPHHIFGDHSHCSPSFCRASSNTSQMEMRESSYRNQRKICVSDKMLKPLVRGI